MPKTETEPLEVFIAREEDGRIKIMTDQDLTIDEMKDFLIETLAAITFRNVISFELGE